MALFDDRLEQEDYVAIYEHYYSNLWDDREVFENEETHDISHESPNLPNKKSMINDELFIQVDHRWTLQKIVSQFRHIQKANAKYTQQIQIRKLKKSEVD